MSTGGQTPRGTVEGSRFRRIDEMYSGDGQGVRKEGRNQGRGAAGNLQGNGSVSRNLFRGAEETRKRTVEVEERSPNTVEERSNKARLGEKEKEQVSAGQDTEGDGEMEESFHDSGENEARAEHRAERDKADEFEIGEVFRKIDKVVGFFFNKSGNNRGHKIGGIRG